MIDLATPKDTRAIYALLSEAKFASLPPFRLAREILDCTPAIVLKGDGRVWIWAGFHYRDEMFLDLVIAPDMPRNLITKGLCKYVLAYGFALSQSEHIAINAYNSKGVKAAMKIGFKLDAAEDREGWVRLVLTREDFERKFDMRGKSL